MLFAMGIIFIIVSIGLIIYNRPKGVSPIDAVLDTTNDMYVDKAMIDLVKNEPVQISKKKKKKVVMEEPAVIIGDDNSESLECPESLGNGGQKNEKRCRAILEKLFGKPFPSVRPKWLKNPGTKRNLEIDMYCHELRLGVEYDGKQHTQMTSFHRDKRELLYQMKKDQYKDKKCKELGVTLLRVPYWAKSDLEGYITRKLREIGKIP